MEWVLYSETTDGMQGAAHKRRNHLLAMAMYVNAKNIFVLDGVGAILSMVLLAVGLPWLHPWLGMPLEVLSWLVYWPTACLVYDGLCWKLANLKSPQWLIGIIFLNTAYCVATTILIGVHFKTLTPWGLAYFISEIPVILTLVAFELKVWRRAFR